VKASRLRKLAVALMLACAGVQPALGEGLLASALALGIRASDHAHSVAFRSDGSHFDVVLSHGEAGAHPDDGATPDHDHLAGVSEQDHVVHVAASEAGSATTRRVVLNAAPALASTLALASVGVPAWSPVRSVEPRARGIDHLKTIVLRV
jgi:hypothetical protein